MVEKWTNEPCSGVDEVVNTFWVLTESLWKEIDPPTNDQKKKREPLLE